MPTFYVSFPATVEGPGVDEYKEPIRVAVWAYSPEDAVDRVRYAIETAIEKAEEK